VKSSPGFRIISGVQDYAVKLVALLG